MVTSRSLHRNYLKWLLRPFWKSKPKVALQPNSIVPRSPRTPLSRLERNYLMARDGYLLPLDILEYDGLLPAGGPESWHDLIVLTVGTPIQLLTHFHDFITYQKPVTNNTALLLGAACTPGDVDTLTAREREQAYWVRKSEQKGTGWRYLDNPPNHRIITSLIGNIASTGGNGANQKRALYNLLTDPFTVPDILAFMKEGCRSFLDYYPNGCALFTVHGGGGTETYLRYALSLLRAKHRVNRLYELYLLPSDDEPLHVPNMRGMLAYALEHEATDKTPTLHFLFQQQTAGAHDTDRALVAGIITLSGASSGIDPTTKFELIRKTVGTWLTVNPKVVPLPLIPMGKVEMLNGRRHEEHYKVSMTEEKGGKRINPVVSAIETMVAEDPAATHFIAVCSFLHKEEMDYIANGVRRFPLKPGGRVHLYFNPCYPAFNADDDTAEALLCDFRGGSGVTECLNNFLLENKATPLLTGLSLPAHRALGSLVPESHLTEEIERELTRILKNDHL